MRRDVFLTNDSGGFSVVSTGAVDAVIAAGPGLDALAAAPQALLLELTGDDSMPVRLVVNEPLREDEEAQWLARATSHLHTADGRLVVMGGFDPDVMTWWKEQTGGTADGRGVAIVEAIPGLVRVDVYAHVGSLNGRRVLAEAGTPPGAAFRRDHPGRAFPVWLAHMLDHSGEDDPGHEASWRDVRASIAGQLLDVDEGLESVVGFLVHVMPADADSSPAKTGPGDWIEWDANRRVPSVFPVGLAADVVDPELAAWVRRAFGRPEPAAPAVIPDGVIDLIDNWPGQPLAVVAPAGADVALPLAELHAVYWMAGFTADSAPLFEVRVSPAAAWTPPAACQDFSVVPSKSGVSLGVPESWGGWAAWWSARGVAQALTGVPDGSTIDVAMAPQIDEDDDERNPAVGLMRYRGTVTGGAWRITEASPPVTHAALADAVALARDVAIARRLPVRGEQEREALAGAAAIYTRNPTDLEWDGDAVRPADGDERTLVLLAGPVFRGRFEEQWAMDTDEDELDDEDEDENGT